MSLVQVRENNANYSDDQKLSAAAEVARISYDGEDNEIWMSIDIGSEDHYISWSFDLREFLEAIGKAVVERE